MKNTDHNIDIYQKLNEEIEGCKEIIEFQNSSAIKILYLKIMKWLKANYQNIIIFSGTVLTLFMFIKLLFSIIWGIYYLDIDVLLTSKQILVVGICIPAINWFYSTCFDYWSFQSRKLFGLTIVILNGGLGIISFALKVLLIFLMPLILRIPINPDITPAMVLSLGRTILSVIIGVYIGYRMGYEQKTKAYGIGGIILIFSAIELIVRYL